MRTPYRLRHVASNKYLAVDTLSPAALLDPSNQSALGGDDDDDDDANESFTAAMVEDADPALPPGALGSFDSLVFYLTPTDESGDALRDGVSTVQLEHRSPHAGALYFKHAKEPKPPMAPFAATHDGHGPPVAAGSGAATGAAMRATGRKQSGAESPGGRVLFGASVSTVDALKLVPLEPQETSAIAKATAKVRVFLLYAHLAQTYAPFGDSEGGSGKGKGKGPAHLALCDKVVAACLDAMDDFLKGSAKPPRRHASLSDAMKEANQTLPATFATFFAGEPDPLAQKVNWRCGGKRKTSNHHAAS
jgi:hypothetical protein